MTCLLDHIHIFDQRLRGVAIMQEIVPEKLILYSEEIGYNVGNRFGSALFNRFRKFLFYQTSGWAEMQYLMSPFMDQSIHFIHRIHPFSEIDNVWSCFPSLPAGHRCFNYPKSILHHGALYQMSFLR